MLNNKHKLKLPKDGKRNQYMTSTSQELQESKRRPKKKPMLIATQSINGW